ncbi:MAG: prepilin-type N-terminal cleavage/methylation domain-containing protein [Chloroflexi bacterium]|nr:prepilin-type N-terminal cleavage/methylation domain-containing protein [Chloroflexota bacterium]
MKEKGFTLIEVLMVMLVGGMVMVAALSTTYQMVVGTDRTNSQVVALGDINQAVLVLRKDLIMAQSTDLVDNDDDPQSSVSLAWIDQTRFGSSNPTSHASNYVLSGTSLHRIYDGVTYIVGRNITALGFTQNGRVINVTITATGPRAQQKQETLRFSVHMRPEDL